MAWLIIIASTITLLAIYSIFKAYFKRVIIYEYQKGLRFKKGKLVAVVGPGSYWYKATSSSIEKLDIRARLVTIAGQEVLSKDSVGLKVSLVGQYKVEDPKLACLASEDYLAALYSVLQIGLRELIGSLEIDAFLENRADFNKQLLSWSAPKARQLGLVLESVEIKDIMFPGELKQIFAQTVKARKEGLAALERARGESAALRNLANAARMLDDNPNLLQLRILQVLGESKGNTVVIGNQTLPAAIIKKQDMGTKEG